MKSLRDGFPVYQRPVELLQHLIRFDTTNTPGNEAACIAFIDGLLKEAGIEVMDLQFPSENNDLTEE